MREFVDVLLHHRPVAAGVAGNDENVGFDLNLSLLFVGKSQHAVSGLCIILS